MRAFGGDAFAKIGAAHAAAGFHELDDDVLRREFVGERFGESFQRKLAGAIERNPLVHAAEAEAGSLRFVRSGLDKSANIAGRAIAK